MDQQEISEFPPFPQGVERIGKACLEAAFKVHSALGPGLLESVYEKALVCELTKRGFAVEAQRIIPIVYDGVQLDSGLRVGLLVDNKVIIELKAVEKMIPLYEAQLLTYLKLSGIRLGYLINFNVVLLKNGIQRRVC